MTREQLQAILDKHAHELGEHFDGLVILGCREAEGIRGDELFTAGSGGAFIRIGLASAFLDHCGPTEEGEGDDWKGGES